MVLKMTLTVAVKTFLVKLAKGIAISIPNVRVELYVEETIVELIFHQDLIVVEFVQQPTMMLTVVPQMVRIDVEKVKEHVQMTMNALMV